MTVDITSILKYYGEVTLCVDLMYVNKVPLLVTLSWNVKFGMVEAVADWKEVTENVPKTLSKAPCLVAKRMSLTLHLLLFA